MLNISLTKTERKILKILAMKEPKTYYDLWKKERVAASNTTVLSSLKSLEQDKKLIRVIHKEQHFSLEGFPRGRKKKFYWLTEEGVIVALTLGVNANLMSEQTQKYLQKSNEIEILIEMSKILGSQTMRQFYIALKNDKIPEFPRDEQTMKRFFKLLMRYPKYRKAFKYVLKNMPKLFKDFLEN